MSKMPHGILCLILIITICNGLKIHQQVTYDSLRSKYDTSSSDFKYYDNLNSPIANYYYRSVTKESYEMSVKLQKLDGYQQCGSTTPYAKKDQSSCMSCPQDRPLFNLGTRECESCKPHTSAKCDAMFNYSTPKVNNTATGNQSTSTANTTSVTTKPSTTTTTTKTTTTKPTTPSYIVEWQPKLKNQTTTINSAQNAIDIFQPIPLTPSTNNNTYNDSLHQNYTIDYRVVTNQTNQANKTQSNVSLIAQSQGQNVTFYDKQCPPATPYYNPTTKTCQNCKENQQYVAIQKKCLPIIYVSNPKTKYVILKEPDQLLKANLKITQAYPERTVRFCEIDKPLAVNGVCIACPAEKIFNFTSQQCQDGCPQGQVFSESNSQCIAATFLTNSDAPNLLSPIRDFQDFRSAQKLRVKSSPTIVQCPLTKPIFINGKCSTCADGLPYFNIESQTCENCQRNRNYNQYTRRCEAPTDSGLEIKKIVPNIF